ncbi:hypothetical protein BJX99DRAFT_244259 [Aspergillus californicus]
MRSLPDNKIRIMLLNPSGGAGFNDLVAETVMKYKDPNTHVTVALLADRIGGTQTLAYPALRPLVYGEMIRACLQCRKENYDALIVNCFGDPMVDELRQIAGDDMVVLGARQMAVETVSRLGCRYAVLSLYDMQGSQDPLLQRCLSDTRTAVSHPVVDMAFNDDLTPMNIEGLRESLATQGELAVRQDGAEALILGCTAMLGCWLGLMRAVGVPVIDPTVAALRAAGEAVRLKRELGWGASTKRAGKVPTENQLEMIAEQSYPYSGRIEIE